LDGIWKSLGAAYATAGDERGFGIGFEETRYRPTENHTGTLGIGLGRVQCQKEVEGGDSQKERVGRKPMLYQREEKECNYMGKNILAVQKTKFIAFTK